MSDGGLHGSGEPPVVKFGGTSLADAGRIRSAARQCLALPGATAVASAMGGVTESLLGAGELAAGGQGAAAQAVLREIELRHRHTLAELGLAGPAAEELEGMVAAAFGELGRQVEGVRLLGEYSPRIRDAMLATGELLSSRMLAAVLAVEAPDTVWVDPRDLVRTDSSFGRAKPDLAAIRRAAGEALAAHRAAGRRTVTGGFVGRDPQGRTTTLGRGGSDYSAALLAAALGAGELVIWTDVDGILTADPRRIPAARHVPRISYAEASELAFFGAKVLHPATLGPAVAAGIPVVIRNSFRPEHPGTRVVPDGESGGAGVRAISARSGVAALFLSDPGMLLAHGHASRIFACFEHRRVAVDVIATSDVSISVTVDATAPLDELIDDLRKIVVVELLRDLAVITVVGRRLRQTPGVAGQVFQALSGINVVLISQGASQTNMTFVVEEAALDDALARLHRALFEETPALAAAAS